jgi:hypothetical protein
MDLEGRKRPGDRAVVEDGKWIWDDIHIYNLPQEHPALGWVLLHGEFRVLLLNTGQDR